VLWFGLAALVLVSDQATKLFAERALMVHTPVEVAPVVSFTLTYNPGIAFSFLGDAGGGQRWLLTGIGIVAVVLVARWLWHLTGAFERALPAALSLVLGGAGGNVVDRVRIGAVVDFIDLHWRQYHWYVFNLADAAITVGAALLVWSSFFGRGLGGSSVSGRRDEQETDR